MVEIVCSQRRCNSTLQDFSQGHDHYALVAQLKNCALQKDLGTGSKLHTLISKHRLLTSNTFIGNTLVQMYGKCGSMTKAQQVFDELHDRNVVSWNAFITGFIELGHCEEALFCLEQMQSEGLFCDTVTFVCILKACGGIGAFNKGKEVHAEIVATGHLRHTIVLGNSLIVMYAKCGALTAAQQVFEELPTRDVVSWNALISGCCQHDQGDKALGYFERMKHDISPDAVTFCCILKACGSKRAIEMGKDVHAEIAMQGLLGHNTMLGSALVDMYAKFGELAKAQQVFNEPIQDVVLWTALIAGYCQYGHAKEALDCLNQMKHEGLFPDSVTFAYILKVCGSLQAADEGRQVHAEVVKNGFLGDRLVLGNALVDMYGKCCELAKTQQVFNELSIRDIVSWSVLITEFCQHGRYIEVVNCYKRIKADGLLLDSVIFSSLWQLRSFLRGQ